MLHKTLKHSLLAFATVMISGTALAQDLTGTLKKIKDTNTITVGHRDASLPFSYYDDQQKVIGYAVDICMYVVNEIKNELKLPNLQVKLSPVTSSTRIPLIANGTIDLECGSTTNNVERQKQVAFGPTYYLTATRFVYKKNSGITNLASLKGKTVVSTAGSTNIKQISEANTAQNLGLTILAAKDHPEAFLMVETGRAAAFVMDDILLAGFVAGAKKPSDYAISEEALSNPEPYALMMPRDDAPFNKMVTAAASKLYKSAEMPALYAKWFDKAVPPKGLILNQPMTAKMKKALATPTNNPDPASY